MTSEPTQEVTKCGKDEKDYFRIRAKVYRFADDEWKERGQGEILIAENSKEKKYRLLLHRDQTLKCAVNLPLIEGVAVKPLGNSDKAVTVAGLDFSDNEKKQTVFAVKFTEAWMCKNFQIAIEHALAGKELSEADLIKKPDPEKPKEDKPSGAKAVEKAVEEVDDKK